MTAPLTGPQMNALRVLRDLNDQCVCPSIAGSSWGKGHSDYCPRSDSWKSRLRSAAPREVARALWPDSVGWSKRTRKFGTNDPGAVGGTMPMKAATVLWRLQARGCAERVGSPSDPLASLWEITERGRRVLDGTDTPLEKKETP